MKEHTFYAVGLHCRSCTVLIERELGRLPEVSHVDASLVRHTVTVAGQFGDKTKEHIARDLNEVLLPHGYSLALTQPKHSIHWSDFKLAIPLALGFIVLFIGLQKIGLVDLVTADEVGLGTALVIGLIASVSTCLAVVGGLVLSLSANFAKEGDKVRPQLLFHLGRLLSFFILGGAIGALGAAFQLGATGTMVLSLLVAAILIVLGLNLLDLFPKLKRWQPTLPKTFNRHVDELKQINHTLTPFLVGGATFFLPCGFTQSMQIYTLTTGDFWTGALTMFSFALGTLPVLALLSFSSLGVHQKAKSSVFFKTAGLIVIFFGIINLLNVLVVTGLIPPLFNL